MNSKFIGLAAFVLMASLAVSALAQFEDGEAPIRQCRMGSTVTVHGSIYQRMPDGDDVWLELNERTSPCQVDGISVSKANAPTNCVNGSSVSATGTVHLYEYGPYIEADSIRCGF